VKIVAEDGGLALVQALKQAHLTASTSEAMRMIEQGGVRLDGERVSDRSLKLAKGTVSVAQVGKRKFARITVV
jgi:tyrosyl-tRNA synthetase